MNIYGKLQKARVLLSSNEMKKSGHNKFAGYQYFELADFLQPIQKICNEVGICTVVSFDKDFAYLTIIDVDAPEGRITITSPFGSAALKGAHEIQNIGAVETYQRRYLYMAAFEIVEHDAIDSSPQVEKKTHSGTDGAFQKLSKEDQEDVRSVALEIIGSVKNDHVNDALELWESIKDNDLKVAVWSLMDSSVRSSIKKASSKKEESK